MVDPTRKIVLPDASATHDLGWRLGQILPAGSILLLQGNLGSGKTSLIQGLAEGLGIIEPIASPTFVLINEYFEGRIPLYHLDLYRLDNPIEVNALQIETYWEGAEYPLGVVAIEWAERLMNKPFEYLQIELQPCHPEGREAYLTAVGERMEITLQQLKA